MQYRRTHRQIWNQTFEIVISAKFFVFHLNAGEFGLSTYQIQSESNFRFFSGWYFVVLKSSLPYETLLDWSNENTKMNCEKTQLMCHKVIHKTIDFYPEIYELWTFLTLDFCIKNPIWIFLNSKKKFWTNITLTWILIANNPNNIIIVTEILLICKAIKIFLI